MSQPLGAVGAQKAATSAMSGPRVPASPRGSAAGSLMSVDPGLSGVVDAFAAFGIGPRETKATAGHGKSTVKSSKYFSFSAADIRTSAENHALKCINALNPGIDQVQRIHLALAIGRAELERPVPPTSGMDAQSAPPLEVGLSEVLEGLETMTSDKMPFEDLLQDISMGHIVVLLPEKPA